MQKLHSTEKNTLPLPKLNYNINTMNIVWVFYYGICLMELRRLRVFAFLTGYTVYCLENVYFFTIFLSLHRPAKLYVKSIYVSRSTT
jgi:hypothetical protein